MGGHNHIVAKFDGWGGGISDDLIVAVFVVIFKYECAAREDEKWDHSTLGAIRLTYKSATRRQPTTEQGTFSDLTPISITGNELFDFQ